MGKVLSAAKWSLDLLSHRIAALRSQKTFKPSTIYSEMGYDESQMKNPDQINRQQKHCLEYDC